MIVSVVALIGSSAFSVADPRSAGADGLRGAETSIPRESTKAAGGSLYFSAEDASHGWELWKSDGTTAGTFMVKDIRPGSRGSRPRSLTAVGGMLFFTADDGIHGWELWKSDGTQAGTVMVKDIWPARRLLPISQTA